MKPRHEYRGAYPAALHPPATEAEEILSELRRDPARLGVLRSVRELMNRPGADLATAKACASVGKRCRVFNGDTLLPEVLVDLSAAVFRQIGSK